MVDLAVAPESDGDGGWSAKPRIRDRLQLSLLLALQEERDSSS